MKFSFAILGLAATGALCSPAIPRAEVVTVQKCSGWDATTLSDSTDVSALENCEKHPSELGITSPLYDPEASVANLTSPAKQGDLVENSLDKRGICYSKGGRGHGVDYDYGCSDGWCWRNCDGPFLAIQPTIKKTWCWLKYEGGNGGWTPCGGWKDCEWSYNNKNAKCAKGNCKACGCGC